jgi:transposase-like protein
MVFETYEMITPKKDSILEYEQFYLSYGRTVKMNLLVNQMLKEIKQKLPIYFLEIMENIERKDRELDAQLLVIGLQKNTGERDKLKKSIGNSDYEFIRKYFLDDLNSYIDFYTNQQLIIGLYAIFESTITEFIRRKKNDYKSYPQEELLIELISLEGEQSFFGKFVEVHAIDISSIEFYKIWNYYTNIRNLYAHTGGIISKRFKDNINGFSSHLKEFTKEKLMLECSLFNITDNDFFQLSKIKVGNLFQINEVNYRFFHHFIVYIWETIYLLEIKNNNTVVLPKIDIVKNVYEFKIYNTPEDLSLMQTMPETLTKYLNKFIINGYKCPNCKNESIFLYKATPCKDFDVSEIVNNEPNDKYKSRKVFTCPFCKSFYFSVFNGYLKDNLGFNILELNDSEYITLLRKFNCV